MPVKLTDDEVEHGPEEAERERGGRERELEGAPFITCKDNSNSNDGKGKSKSQGKGKRKSKRKRKRKSKRKRKRKRNDKSSDHEIIHENDDVVDHQEDEQDHVVRPRGRGQGAALEHGSQEHVPHGFERRA